jgi:PRC-barrel domain
MAGNGRAPLPSLILFTFLIAYPGTLHAQQPAASPPSPETQSSPQPPLSPPAKQPEVAPKPAGEGIPALVVDGDQMMGILGRQVRSSAGEDMGRIVDVIIDRSARVRAAVIDFGGFLGVGNRQIAVAWSAIRLPAQDKPGALVVDFTRDQLRVAPAYKAGEQVVLLGQGDASAPTSGGAAAEKEAPKEQPSK